MPQQFHKPQRSQNRFPSVAIKENYHDNWVQHQGRAYRNFNNSNNNYQLRVQQNSGLQDLNCNGYLKEFTFVDENGRPKTVMAWDPRDNELYLFWCRSC